MTGAGNIREFLLNEVRYFVENASKVKGIRRIALVGSLATEKPNPKDADVLVTNSGDTDMERLAKLGRRLKGKGQSRNSGADIFLCDEDGKYLGRICSYRDCHHRVLCEGSQCRPGNRINNDFHQVKLEETLVREPPIELWPDVFERVEVPKDFAKHCCELTVVGCFLWFVRERTVPNLHRPVSRGS